MGKPSGFGSRSRFAAFTLFRMLQQTGTISNQVVHTATQDLKAALDTAGYSY